MSLLRRYVAREIVGAVSFVLAGFLALFAFFDFVNELDDIGQAGYKLQHAVLYVLLGLPSRVYELAPIAALIGAIYALSQFAAHSEFTAMRAAGMSRRRALTIVGTLGLWMALVTALTGELLAPVADRLASNLRMSTLASTVGAQFRSGLWIKDTLKDASGAVSKLRFVNVAEMRPDTTLRAVRVFEFDSQYRLESLIESANARFSPTGGWVFLDAEVARFSAQAVADTTTSLRADRTRHAQLAWTSELTPDILGVLVLVPERMSAWSLLQYVQHLRDNRQRTDRYEIALWKKAVYPLAVVVMLALALPFGYLQVRAGGIGYKVFAGIMLGVGFHFLNGLFSHLGLLNTWPAWLAVSIPSLAALLLAMGMLAWVDRAR